VVISNVCKLLHFTQHVNVVLPVEYHEKLCFIVPPFEAGTILLSKMCYTMEYLRFVLVIVGYMYNLENFSGRD